MAAELGGAELLFESERTRVLRVRPSDGTASRITKELRGPTAAKRLRHELSILERLAGVAGVPHLAGVPAGPNMLALEDTAGVPLAIALAEPLDVVAVLQLAHRLACIVAAMHRAGVVHKDINPTNIVVSGADRAPTLIDFDLATTFAEERPGFTHESEIVGTLAYLAPEQTGRTGRGVDQRADLYALGATLYALATGRPPFGDGDPLRLIHDHLALVPRSPSELNAAIPEMLSNIILRLLEKEPDARYQSAEGLAHDIARLRAQLQPNTEPANLRTDSDAGGLLGSPGKHTTGENTQADLFILGEHDFPSRLSAPSRLVGRDTEISALRTAFDNAMHGPGRGILVAGAPGVGKTALINELRPMVTAVGGWFVSGKADQYRGDAASGAVAQALGAIARMLLAEPPEQLATQRVRILRALGNNVGVITATVPELAVLLGSPPSESPEGDPLKAEARLIQSALLLLRAIASPARPVVMVLDDLQWAAAAAISLVDAILMDQELQGLLLVGAYREAEVDPAHPLSAMLSRWTRLGLAPPLVRLQNLPAADLSTLLGHMLRLPLSEAGSLAEAVGARTGGNPYDTVELVNTLRRDGALVLGDAGWSWDAATIRRHVGHGDVVALLAARIKALPRPSRVLVEIMACLGGEVDQGLLGVASGMSSPAMEVQLAPPLEDGLLMIEQTGDTSVRFRHDRVQQAALSCMQPVARRRMHLQLARRLVRVPQLEALAAEQYLAAVEAVRDPEERRRVASLFREVAAAIRLTNYPVAERFLAAAVGLLDTAVGDEDLLRLAVQIERHSVLFSLGRLDEADDLYRSIERGCSDPLELAKATPVQMSSLTNRSRQREAGELGLGLLRKLGLDVPEVGQFGAAVAQMLGAFYIWVEALPPPTDVRADEAETHDPRVRAATRLIIRLLTPGLFADPQVRAWLSLESRRLWSAHGLCPQMVANLGSMTAMTIALRQDYRTGYAAARYALAVGEVRGYEPETSIARFIFATTAQLWFEPLEDCVGQVQLAREGLIRGGDLRIASLAYNDSMVGLLDTSASLDAYAAEVAAGLAFAARTGNDQFTASFLAHRQLIRALRGETDAPGSFTDSSFDEEAHRAGLGSNATAALSMHIQRALGAAIFGDAEVLARHAAATMDLFPLISARYPLAQAYVLQALALAQRARAAQPDERVGLVAELDVCRDWLALRAADAPANFLHLLKLVEAERAWAVDDFRAAVYAFEAAHRAVEQRGRPWHAALIAERAALFHLEQGLEHAGRHLLAEARARYVAWGALGKVRELDRAYAFVRPVVSAPSANSALRSSAVSADAIDLLAVLRASQALSSETNLERLRARVVEVLSAMTGATGVRVLFWNDDAQVWFLPATAGRNDAPMSVDEAGGLGLLPLSAFRYAARTHEPLLVEDATHDDRFARDPYLVGLDHCSLLVVPILARGAPRAMLLLENRLSRRAFSAGRLDAVMLIAGQLAVSLDNALAERFRSLVQRSSDVTLVCNRAGVLSYASAASAEMLGIEDAALTGRAVVDLLHVDDRAAFDRLAGGVRSGDTETLECRVLSADGALRWVEATFTDLSADAAVGGIVVHLRDVTERRRLEGELRRAQKLESVGQLSAGIAHEMNTPIQFVGDNVRFVAQAFTDLAAVVAAYRQTDPSGPVAAAERLAVELDTEYLLEEVPRAVTQTLDGVARMATVVRAMKAFGDPRSDTRALSDLNEAVRNTLVVADSEIRYVADVVMELGVLPLVWCNLGDINQVVLNLVVNAAQAVGEAAALGRERGTITVRTYCVEDDIVLQVQDTGTGIPAEIAERVFEQFFTTRSVGRGTGQGLAVAYSLIHDRHAGNITFTSEPGLGTTFSVRLPQHGADQPPGAAAEVAA